MLRHSIITFSILSTFSIHLFFYSNAIASEANSKFDGVYTYTHFCDGEDSSKYDGSRFIVNKGILSNNRGGAGRWVIKKKFKVKKNGKLKFKGSRKGKRYTVQGKFIINEKEINGKFLAKRHYKSGSGYDKCNMVFKKVGEVKKKPSFKDNRKITEIIILSKNTNDDITLLNEKGKNQKVRVELRNLEDVSNGLIIVVPSSTPNMDDEKFYEKQVSTYGYATAIVYGAEPRYQKKFTGSYTSSMILYDAITTIKEVSKKYSEPREVIIIGSSTGSLAVFKSGWEDLRNKYPAMKLIKKGFMINAACPDTSEAKYNKEIQMYAINGKQDESTPHWVCKNLKNSTNYSNLHLLTYAGGHHFESPMYPPSKYDINSMHALPTCSLNYKSNLHQIIKKRDGTIQWNGEQKGYQKDQKKWFGKNCIDKGTLQGYEEDGAKSFWQDVKAIIVDNKEAKKLKGY